MRLPLRPPELRNLRFRNTERFRIARGKPGLFKRVSNSAGDPGFAIAGVQNEQRVGIPQMQVIEMLVRFEEYPGLNGDHVREADNSWKIPDRILTGVYAGHHARREMPALPMR